MISSVTWYIPVDWIVVDDYKCCSAMMVWFLSDSDGLVLNSVSTLFGDSCLCLVYNRTVEICNLTQEET